MNAALSVVRIAGGTDKCLDLAGRQVRCQDRGRIGRPRTRPQGGGDAAKSRVAHSRRWLPRPHWAAPTRVLGQDVGQRLSDLPGYAETIAPVSATSPVSAGTPAPTGTPLLDSLTLPAAPAPSCSPLVDEMGVGSGKPGSHWGPACPQCDENPTHAIVGLFGYDSFRGVADDSWQNNGLHAGFNYGTRLGKFSEWTGLGFQIGGTVGVFDWAGTDYRPANQDKAETQGFLTYGLFRKPDENCRVTPPSCRTGW